MSNTTALPVLMVAHDGMGVTDAPLAPIAAVLGGEACPWFCIWRSDLDAHAHVFRVVAGRRGRPPGRLGGAGERVHLLQQQERHGQGAGVAHAAAGQV